MVSGAILIDQSMLTGESVPVDAELGHQVYAGSLVRRGEAVAEVTATGAKTYFGRTAELVRIAHVTSSEQKAVFAAARSLATVNGIVAIMLIAYAVAQAFPPSGLIRLALTALLASVPVALPATFTLSAALGAQTLARRGVLLTRLSAAHEAATMDLLCSDKTGTLTQNTLDVDAVSPLPGFNRDQVLARAVAASSPGNDDPIDATIRRAAAASGQCIQVLRLERFVPFDPSTKMSEAFGVDAGGKEVRVVKGAFQALIAVSEIPAYARNIADDLARAGHRVIGVATGPPTALRLAGSIALSDPRVPHGENYFATPSVLGSSMTAFAAGCSKSNILSRGPASSSKD